MKGFAENFYFFVISTERSEWRDLMRPLDFARGDINHNTQRWCRPSAWGAS